MILNITQEEAKLLRQLLRRLKRGRQLKPEIIDLINNLEMKLIYEMTPIKNLLDNAVKKDRDFN